MSKARLVGLKLHNVQPIVADLASAADRIETNGHDAVNTVYRCNVQADWVVGMMV